MALNTMYKAKPNSPQTTLAADITASATSMTLSDATVLPAAPNLCTIGNDENAEVVSYTTISGNVVSGLIRGVSGTTASVWTAGTVVARDYTSYDHDTFVDNINDLNTSKAPLSSPTFTGTPQAPTPSGQNNSTSISTTAFVQNKFSNVTYYVDGTVGNDSNDGTDASFPFKTIAKAISVSYPTQIATINVAAGTYDGFTLSNSKSVIIACSGTLVINGRIVVSNRAFCTLQADTLTVNVSTGINAIEVSNFANLTIPYSADGRVVTVNYTNIDDGYYNAIYVNTGGRFIRYNRGSLTVSMTNTGNTKYAAVNINGSMAILGDVTITANKGIVCDGSTVTVGTISGTQTTQYQTLNGGRIYSGAQTSVPNY